MRYRLAALPAAWLAVDEYIIEDEAGGLYLLNACAGQLEPLDPADANVMIQWFELSQCFSWHTASDLVNKTLRAATHASRLMSSAPVASVIPLPRL